MSNFNYYNIDSDFADYFLVGRFWEQHAYTCTVGMSVETHLDIGKPFHIRSIGVEIQMKQYVR